jgi:hypothetical protein
MFRRVHPEALSRWDGQAWSHQELPFDRKHIGRTILDDRGHLLISLRSYPDEWYDEPCSAPATLCCQPKSQTPTIAKSRPHLLGLFVPPLAELAFGPGHRAAGTVVR